MPKSIKLTSKNYIERLKTTRSKRFTPHIFIAVFAVIGVAMLLFSQAATPVVFLEAESGSLTSPATLATNSSASGGQTIKFGSGAQTAGGWPSSPPAQICTTSDWNGGPVSAPAGSITVPAGNNSSFNFNQASKTFWFAPGVHTLGTSQFGQIIPGANSTYIGAPGAIIDGQNINRYATTGQASGVTVSFLEIRNFGSGLDNNNEGVINHDAATGFTLNRVYAHHNDGAAVFMGSNNVIQYSCLKDNGQYGFSMYKPPILNDSAIKNITIDHTEIVGNNQDNWESRINGCGCTGGGKFWDVKGARLTNNYVHDNLSVGLWADTNDIDFLFEGNWIEGNSDEGIWYEISYNAKITKNVLKRNAHVKGNVDQGSPGAAIYLSESGGDSRTQSTTTGTSNLEISYNLLEDNFSGISIYENTNRFCNSNGNTSKGYCTPFVTPTLIAEPWSFDYADPISASHPCYTQVANEPFRTNCRWSSQNIKVFNNEFRFNAANVPCAGTYCGVHALYATGANNLAWMPYTVSEVQNDVMFNKGNVFSNNKYIGNWRFAKGYGEKIDWNAWRAAPFNQDAGSTFQ